MIEENNKIRAKFLALPKPNKYEKSERKKFLENIFMGRTSEFCEFMGHMTSVLSNDKKIRKAEIISIMDDIAMAALHIGREDGWTSALKDYGEPCFQFLLNAHKETAA